jgi:dTDP-4-amino-4,6-dideoxygalactose transaminase
VRSQKLPSFYFEKITTLQCRAMLRNIQKLSTILLARRKMAARLTQAIDSVYTDGSNRSVVSAGNTYWQFVIPVRSTSAARDFLFSMGVETNTTNLRDLALEDRITLPGVRALKERCIFIPLHDHLKVSDYQKIIKRLSDFEQLEA